MDLNRNHYLIAGIFVVLIGVQLRLVESYMLNEDTTRWLMNQTGHPAAPLVETAQQVMPAVGPTPRKTIVPPDWTGWAALSLGSVLVLHALALPRPG